MHKIVLTGGGTAGHVTPNIALLPHLRKDGFDIHYIGTASGIEHALITKEKISFHAITAGKLRRYVDFKNVTDIFRIGLGFFQAFFILLRLRPQVVFSKGGFVACPVVWSAWLLRIPTIIHESDITPGLANRLCLPFAKKICYSFPETASHIDQRKAVHTGLPVRDDLYIGDKATGLKLCGFSNPNPVVLIMGGSQGSVMVNNAVRSALADLTDRFNICHLCGKGNRAEGVEIPAYRQFEYVTDELPHLFAATDIFIGRSGATTLFELLALKKPSLLIPLATGASRGDQIINAESFLRLGFSHVLKQEEVTAERLVSSLTTAFNERQSMIDAMQRSSTPDGVSSVMKLIRSYC